MKGESPKKAFRKGFTLIELMIVGIILSVLAAIALISMKGSDVGAIKASMKSDARNAITAEQTLYYATRSYESATADASVSDTAVSTVIDTNYPDIKLVASPGNTVTVTATDNDGDGKNECFTVDVSNSKVNTRITYDSCSDTPSIQEQ